MSTLNEYLECVNIYLFKQSSSGYFDTQSIYLFKVQKYQVSQSIDLPLWTGPISALDDVGLPTIPSATKIHAHGIPRMATFVVYKCFTRVVTILSSKVLRKNTY